MNGHDPCLPEADGSSGEPESYPMGFKVAVGLTAAYLLWRFVQGVLWLISRLFV
jgi:hypothetical protein